MKDAFIVRRGGSGGSDLNFRVLGGTTAPSSPKENDIWVNTDTEITGWNFGGDDPNLLDFTTWANGIDVQSGTKSVSGNSIELTANASGDCYTNYGATSLAKIPCTPGKTYIMQWDYSGSDGWVYLFPNADMAGLVQAAAAGGKLEYTAGVDVTFFTFRMGVQDANASAVYSNIRITEKDRAFSPGSVWITTGATSSVAFNAVKKNGLMVYPGSASQYINGAWVEKTAKSYQGGAWVDWLKDLFNNGVVCEFNTFKESNLTLTIGNVIKTETASGSWGHFWAISTKEKIDVTPFTKLCMDATFTYVTEGSGLGVLSEVIDASSDITNVKPWAAMVSLNTAGTRFEVDISRISGQYYCGVWCQGNANQTTKGTITRIWLE